MYLNACNTTATGSNSAIMRFVTESKELFTIKVFDIKGKRAKTILANSITEIQELKSKMLDLEEGMYILNAFLKDEFIKSFRYIKQ